MTSEETLALKTGVAKLFEAGATEAEVRALLLERGWDESDILNALDISEIVEVEKVEVGEKVGETEVAKETTVEAPTLAPEVELEKRELTALPSVVEEISAVVMPVQLSSPLALLARTFSLTFSRFGNIFVTLLATSVISGVIVALVYYFVTIGGAAAILGVAASNSSIGFVVIPLIVFGLLVFLFLLGGLQMVLPASLITAFDKEKQPIAKNINQGFRRAYPLFWVAVLTSLLVTVGSVLFIIPGLIFAVWFYFAPAIVVQEKVSPLRALLLSRELVRGNFFPVALRIIIFSLLTAVFAIVCLGVTAPLSFIDEQNIGTGIILVLFVSVVIALIAIFFTAFSFAFYSALYQELRVGLPTARPSQRLAVSMIALLIFSFIVVAVLGVAFSSAIGELVAEAGIELPSWLLNQDI